jgi:hypothetical protein
MIYSSAIPVIVRGKFIVDEDDWIPVLILVPYLQKSTVYCLILSCYQNTHKNKYNNYINVSF